MATGVNAYDTDASESVQTNINSICSQLMPILTRHSTDVNNFNSEFQTTEVGAMCIDAENRLGRPGIEVMNIISLVQRTLGLNDDTTHQILSRARGAVASIRREFTAPSQDMKIFPFAGPVAILWPADLWRRARWSLRTT